MAEQPGTYQRIIESAQELIHSSSYSEVGVAAICEKANVKKGSFYHFFPSKQELTLAVIEQCYVDAQENFLTHAFTPGLAPMERLARFLNLAIEMHSSTFQETGHILGCPFGNLATEMATQDESIRKKLDQSFKKFQALIKDTLAEAVEKKEIEKVNVDATAQAFLAFFEGAVMLAKTENNPAILKQLLPAALKIRI